MANSKQILHISQAIDPGCENSQSSSGASKQCSKQEVNKSQRIFGLNITNISQVGPGIYKNPFDKESNNNLEIDNNAQNDPQLCSEYSQEIEKYLRTVEAKHIAKIGYMALQPDINEKMRGILIDWLVDVHLKFKLQEKTLYLAVNILDRYLEKETVMRDKLQLVGSTAMLLASKIEEIYPPEIRDFVFISDNAYAKAEIISMEEKMLKTLEFSFNSPSCFCFLNQYRKYLGINEVTYCLAEYLIELSLVEYKLLKFSPSHQAAAALFLADKLLNKQVQWDYKIGEKIGYKEASLRNCAKELVILMQLAEKSTLQAVRKKYSTLKYKEVAKIKIAKRNLCK